jgi:Skp family chaperone for outer membrane proteins
MISKSFNKIIFFCIVLFTTCAYSNTEISYIDLNSLLNNSLAGKSISSQIEKINSSNVKKLKTEEKKIKKEEADVISQKNVLSESEYEKKLVNLRENIKIYNISRNNLIKETNKKRINAEATLIKELSPILAEYLEKNNISLVIQKKNIIIGKSELDITKDIIAILDKKVKKITIK